MNTQYRKNLPGTALDYFDTRTAVDAIQPGAYATLPYTSRVLAENLVRRCDPATLEASLRQLIERRQDLDFPWFPARVVCHDILGQTALVDLAGLLGDLEQMGFGIVAFACTTCNGMSGALDPAIQKEVIERDLYATAAVSYTHLTLPTILLV